MFFTRVASFLTFTLALGSSAIASPVAAPKVDLAGRSTDVTPAFQSVFTNLKTTTNVVLPQLRMLILPFPPPGSSLENFKID